MMDDSLANLIHPLHQTEKQLLQRRRRLPQCGQELHPHHDQTENLILRALHHCLCHVLLSNELLFFIIVETVVQTKGKKQFLKCIG